MNARGRARGPASARRRAGSVPAVELRCWRSVVGDLPVLHVAGEIDLATVPELRDAAHRLVMEAPGRTVAVDLDGVTVLDDTGLGILLGTAGRARDRGGDVIVVCTTPRLREWFDASGLARAIEVRDRLS